MLVALILLPDEVMYQVWIRRYLIRSGRVGKSGPSPTLIVSFRCSNTHDNAEFTSTMKEVELIDRYVRGIVGTSESAVGIMYFAIRAVGTEDYLFEIERCCCGGAGNLPDLHRLGRTEIFNRQCVC